MLFFLWSSDSIRGTHLAQIFLYLRCLLRILWRRDREIWGNFSCSWSRVQCLSCRMCSSACFFRSSVMRDGCPDHSSSWTFLLSALTTPLPHTWLIHYTFTIHCCKLSVNANSTGSLCVQKMGHRSHFTVGGIISFLNLFRHKNCSNDAIGAKLTWNKDKGPLRSSDLESARKVDLRKHSAQTVFTFWTTLVLFFFALPRHVSVFHLSSSWGVPRFLMLAGSVFYIHLLHSSSVEWHYALNGENTALFSGVAFLYRNLIYLFNLYFVATSFVFLLCWLFPLL
jgi:hypothetical protein